MTYTIAIGADHRGFLLKKELITLHQFGDHTIIWNDVGTFSSERTDYPLYAKKVVHQVLHKEVSLGLLICGTGIGASITANRYPSIYAGVVWNKEVARKAKEDDNITILVLPADFMSREVAISCIIAWLSTPFKEGRYRERLESIDSSTN